MSNYIKVANATNRRWIVFFISLVGFIFAWLVILLLPETNFIIIPKKVSVSTDVTVKFDMDVKDAIPDLAIVPAFNSGGQASSILKDKSYINFSYSGQLISYKYQDYQTIFDAQINKLIPAGFIINGDKHIKSLGELESSVSGRQFSQRFNVSQAIIADFSLLKWQEIINQKTEDEALGWLISQENVDEVKVDKKFALLANISKIILKFNPRYIVTLDR